MMDTVPCLCSENTDRSPSSNEANVAALSTHLCCTSGYKVVTDRHAEILAGHARRFRDAREHSSRIEPTQYE